MGLTHKRSGKMPAQIWTPQDSHQLAQQVLAAVVQRIHVRGCDVNDAPFGEYSTAPIALDFRHPSARRLKPRGGEPMYGNPMKPYVGNPMKAYVWSEGRAPSKKKKHVARRRERSVRYAAGEVATPNVTTIVGRRYRGGNRQRMLESRGTDQKQLVLSGEMMRSWRVKSATVERIVIGLEGGASVYASHLNKSSHSGNFAGFSRRDMEAIRKAFDLLLRARWQRATRGGGSPTGDLPELDG